MKIKRINSQHRRDFWAIYRTEANIMLMALLALVLILAVILTNNLVQLENLELNRHILEDCKIDPTEIDDAKSTKLDLSDF